MTNITTYISFIDKKEASFVTNLGFLPHEGLLLTLYHRGEPTAPFAELRKVSGRVHSVHIVTDQYGDIDRMEVVIDNG